QVVEDFPGPSEIAKNSRVWMGQFCSDCASPPDGVAILKRRGNQFAHAVRPGLKMYFARVQPGHFDGLADDAVDAVAFFVDDNQKFAPLPLVESQVFEQACCGGLDGREWSFEIMGDGIQKHGLEPA